MAALAKPMIFLRVHSIQFDGVKGKHEWDEVTYSRESVYNVYNVDYQQLKCLQKGLQNFKSVYIIDSQ